jgi:AraC family transcriptional regulator, regulatory protein of adaptative response / methylated-DNA-[protein]-cysteine methyltransferase
MDTPEQHYHFGVIRRAIEQIDAAGGMPLTLDQLASDMGMSPAHFQRVFTQWAGVSPKRYQQYLTLDHAKDLLRLNHTTLETAQAMGLSGSGRLHDLFVTWQAMTPGQYARGGEGLTIYWGWFDGPFGDTLAMGTDKGLCAMGFASETGRDATLDDLKRRWPAADYVEDPSRIAPWVAASFGSGSGQSGDMPLHLIGAPFHLQVWQALLNIPSGHVTTYSDIAQAIGNPKAVRAVGTAVGRNPISWIIPCHRALRKSGGLGGYHWGLPVKRAMLAWEGARVDCDSLSA